MNMNQCIASDDDGGRCGRGSSGPVCDRHIKTSRVRGGGQSLRTRESQKFLMARGRR